MRSLALQQDEYRLFDHVDRIDFVDRCRGRMEVTALPTGVLTLGIVQSTGHDIALVEPGRTTFLAPLHGRIHVDAGEARLDASAGALLFLRSGHRTTSVRADEEGGFLAAVVLAPENPAAHSSAGRVSPGRSFAGDLPSTGKALQGFLSYFVTEYLRQDSPVRRPAALGAAAALISDLVGELARLDLPPVRSVATPVARVTMAEEIMRARSDEPLTIESLAREVGVGTRTLQAAFRSLRGVSPRAVLNSFRLDCARQRLLAPEPFASVTDVAIASGFAHLGRFAAAYRARFGETPSETLARARR